MSIEKDSSRQQPLVARKSFTYAELGAAITASLGNLQTIIDLPVGAIVTGGYLAVTTAFVGPTVATLDVGDVADPDRYSSSAIDLLVAARTALTLTGFKTTSAAGSIQVDPVLTVAPASAGVAELVVEYIVENRAQENQG